nr:atp-dependent 6-phosphofructokinase 3 [Quercus suber]
MGSKLFEPSPKRLRNNVLAKDEVERFIAFYANFDEDLCLIPESPFYLEGVGGEFGNKLHQDVSLYISKIKITYESL